ncbi:MAG: ubiquinol-cytochrome c reductase iron-sulfur subunit [Pseudomonadales bacterium]|nr:ubiquinol-cytochrome c reductase iron-sulfur subunit [Pseudomonadales bacterium]
MSNDGVDSGRRMLLIGATAAVGAVGAVGAAIPFVKSWLPSAKAKAAGAPVDVDISQIQPGQRIIVKWRGRPVWVLRRTPEELASLKEIDPKLRDPNSDDPQQPDYAKNEWRSIKPEFLVLIGICTHLGCSPLFVPEIGKIEPSWLGGFFCPCHGSKYDLAGRVYSGQPAPKNMVVPPYSYTTPTVITIGVDKENPA